MSEQAVVLFSGGQDSTTCLAWAIDKFGHGNVYPVSFNYGQKHSVELQCAEQILDFWSLTNKHRIFDVPFLKMLPAALTQAHNVDVELEASDTSQNEFAHKHNLPSTFVPGRNMLFFTMGAAYGATKDIYNLVTGVCEADDAGYPDCRAPFVHRAQSALCAALDYEPVIIYAPLLRLNKAKTWKLAEDLNCIEVVRLMTHTCYHGVHDEDHFHEWGYGCGECPACIERKNGYAEYVGESHTKVVGLTD